jgi:hypothetical protein
MTLRVGLVVLALGAGALAGCSTPGPASTASSSATPSTGTSSSTPSATALLPAKRLSPKRLPSSSASPPLAATWAARWTRPMSGARHPNVSCRRLRGPRTASSTTGRASTCRPASGPRSTVLATPRWVPARHGESITKDNVTCESAEAGITCRDSATGHGSTIARDAYKVF